MIFAITTFQTIILDGYKNLNTSATVPIEQNFINGLSNVEGFIIPYTTVSETRQWVDLAEKLNKTIVGWRVVPQADRDPRVSVQQAIGFLKSKDLLGKNHTVFIDARKTFQKDCKLNQRFITEMYDELQMHLGGPKRIGVLTKRTIWQENVCDMKWDHVKLWYVNQNDKASFSDFLFFGGWKQPYAKQFSQKTIQDVEEGEKYAASLTFM